MKHLAMTDEMTEMAALYALGALSQHEAKTFEEHLAEGCDACREELESFEMTLEALSYETVEAKPSLKVRDDLLSRINVEEASAQSVDGQASSDEFVSIHADGGQWVQACEGVSFKLLFVDKQSGLATSLVRMKPGARLPRHRHTGVEQFYILEGDCNVCGERLGPGGYHRAAAGSIHDETYTVEGTLFLLIAPERYEVLEAR
ncbi:MAG TPA: cupin domain-containing protein [Blastocatellia bacterium]|nr:cupin domain-containing protein [Blastocatellia bacterium]